MVKFNIVREVNEIKNHISYTRFKLLAAFGVIAVINAPVSHNAPALIFLGSVKSLILHFQM